MSSAAKRNRLLISQEDSLVHEMTISTNPMLDPRTGPAPYPLKRNSFSSMRRQLIEYLGVQSSDGTRSLSPKDLVTHEMTIHRLLRTRFSEDSKLLTPRRNPPSSKRQLINYDSTRPKGDKLSIKGFLTREDLPIATALNKEDSTVH